jgi:hypothetical protein
VRNKETKIISAEHAAYEETGKTLLNLGWKAS